MKTDTAKTFFLGAITALLLVLAAMWIAGGRGGSLPGMETAHAANAGGAANGFIMLYNEQGENLFIMDTKNLRVVAYEWEDSDGELLLKSGRNIEYDLKVTTLADKDGLTYDDVKKALRGK